MKGNFKNNKSKKIYTNVAIFVFVVLLISGMFFSDTYKKAFQTISSKISQFATVLSSVLVLETNSFRATNNESSLAVSDVLTKAAQMKADDMALKGYFSHTGPQGEAPWVWFKQAGYVYSYAGENLAVDYTESADVTTGWINSAKHKANLLNVNFTEVGIGVADGMYQGHKTTFVVQFFAKPYKAEASKPVIKTNNAVATVKEAQVPAVKPIATTSNSLLASSSPTTAIVTTSDLSDGEVLGVDVNNSEQTNNNQLKLFAIIGFGLLVIIALSVKMVSMKRKKN